jgi:alanyl-tRNA synthetase/misacylated tRNA(Ala) deacylase
LHDVGKISGEEVVDVFKQGGVIVHVLNKITDPHKMILQLGVELEVNCEIDLDRRLQLAKHHTATHIVNAAARKVLGNHINQAGAKKDIDKATIDLTHYQSITDEELQKIEEEANKLVKKSLHVHSSFLPRTEAEQTYGMNIYQGGAVPGKLLRIVNIDGIDVEACGGTHLKNTSEAGEIKILKAAKISDGIVRLYFTAGEAAQKEKKTETSILEEAAKLLNVKIEQLPSRVNELFEKWKLAKKFIEKKKEIGLKELELTSKEEFKGNVLDKVAETLKTQPEHVMKTIKRFLNELEEYKNKIRN